MRQAIPVIGPVVVALSIGVFAVTLVFALVRDGDDAAGDNAGWVAVDGETAFPAFIYPRPGSCLLDIPCEFFESLLSLERVPVLERIINTEQEYTGEDERTHTIVIATGKIIQTADDQVTVRMEGGTRMNVDASHYPGWPFNDADDEVVLVVVDDSVVSAWPLAMFAYAWGGLTGFACPEDAWIRYAPESSLEACLD